MANNLTTDPIVIDTFSVDVVISAIGLKVKSIIFTSDSVGDVFVLEDVNGVEIFRAKINSADASIVWTPSDGQWFNKGVYLNVSRGTYTGTAKALIYIY